MDVAADFAFETRTSVFQLLSTPDEGLDLATEISVNSPLIGRRSKKPGGPGASPLMRSTSMLTSASAREMNTRLASKVTPLQQMAAALLCCLLGLGALTSWFAIGAGLLFFGSRLPVDRAFFIWMLSAYYGPMMMSLVLQRSFERKAKWWYSTPAFAARFSISYIATTAAMVLTPHVASQPGLLAIAGAVGFFESIGLGAASQLFKLLPAQCYGHYFTGTSLACVAIVMITYFSGFAEPEPSQAAIEITYYSAAGMAGCASLAGLGLLFSKLGRHFIQHGHLDMAMADTAKYTGTVSSASLFVKTWRYQLAVLSMSFSTMLLTALVPFVPSQTDTWNNTQWRLVLLFVIMVSMVLGRQVRCYTGAKFFLVYGGKSLSFWVILRFLVAAAGVVYVMQPIFLPQDHAMFLSDLGTVGVLAAFCASGGILLPPAYDLARVELHPISHSKLDNMFTLFGLIGIYVGLFAAFVIASATTDNTTSLIPFSFS